VLRLILPFILLPRHGLEEALLKSSCSEGVLWNSCLSLDRASDLQTGVHLNLRTACRTFSNKGQRTFTSRTTSQPRKTYLQSIRNTKLWFEHAQLHSDDMIAGIACLIIVCIELLQFLFRVLRRHSDIFGVTSRLRVEIRAHKAINVHIKTFSPHTDFVSPF